MPVGNARRAWQADRSYPDIKLYFIHFNYGNVKVGCTRARVKLRMFGHLNISFLINKFNFFYPLKVFQTFLICLSIASASSLSLARLKSPILSNIVMSLTQWAACKNNN